MRLKRDGMGPTFEFLCSSLSLLSERKFFGDFVWSSVKHTSAPSYRFQEGGQGIERCWGMSSFIGGF